MISPSTRKRQKSKFEKAVSVFVCLTFIFSLIVPPAPIYAQPIQTPLNLPLPGSMLTTSPGFIPTIVRGLKIFPDDPLRFNFIVDRGDEGLESEELENSSLKLVKYFLAALTVPENEMWVNLSPYEKDRIIPNSFSQTEMGRDLLGQDYLLKQLTASLMYPEDELGQKFWNRVYKRAAHLFGTTDIPINTFNKVWIIPDQATVLEDGDTAYIINSHLKVMLEEDYLSLKHNIDDKKRGTDQLAREDVKALSNLSSNVVKEVLIPEIEKEVNKGENFANLRQIYNSMILAIWYKENLRESLLGQVYVDKAKTAGIDVDDPQIKEKIYQHYLEAFKKGVYDLIKEDVDPVTDAIIPRRYISGGMGAPDGVTSLPITEFRADPTIVPPEAQRNFSSFVDRASKGGDAGVAAAGAVVIDIGLAENPRDKNVDWHALRTAPSPSGGDAGLAVGDEIPERKRIDMGNAVAQGIRGLGYGRLYTLDLIDLYVRSVKNRTTNVGLQGPKLARIKSIVEGAAYARAEEPRMIVANGPAAKANHLAIIARARAIIASSGGDAGRAVGDEIPARKMESMVADVTQGIKRLGYGRQYTLDLIELYVERVNNPRRNVGLQGPKLARIKSIVEGAAYARAEEQRMIVANGPAAKANHLAIIARARANIARGGDAGAAVLDPSIVAIQKSDQQVYSDARLEASDQKIAPVLTAFKRALGDRVDVLASDSTIVGSSEDQPLPAVFHPDADGDIAPHNLSQSDSLIITEQSDMAKGTVIGAPLSRNRGVSDRRTFIVSNDQLTKEALVQRLAEEFEAAGIKFQKLTSLIKFNNLITDPEAIVVDDSSISVTNIPGVGSQVDLYVWYKDTVDFNKQVKARIADSVEQFTKIPDLSDVQGSLQESTKFPRRTGEVEDTRRIRIAINGARGRIGKLAFTQMLRDYSDRLQVVAIHGPDADQMIEALDSDSAHGSLIPRSAIQKGKEGNREYLDITLNGRTDRVYVYSRKAGLKVTELPWREHDVDIAIDAVTGKTKAALEEHIAAGAKLVVNTAPSKADDTGEKADPIVFGVNQVRPLLDRMAKDCASCTTNSAAAVIKGLLQEGTDAEWTPNAGYLETVHSATGSNVPVEGGGKESIIDNLILGSTGAGKALAPIIPSLKGKMPAHSLRFNSQDVSLTTLAMTLTVPDGVELTADMVNDRLRESAKAPENQGIFAVENGVSSSAQLRGRSESSIVFADATRVQKVKDGVYLVKIATWYDNEWGYATRISDTTDELAWQLQGGVDKRFIESGKLAGVAKVATDLKGEDLRGKRILYRGNINVPINKETGVIEDDARLQASLAEIKSLRDSGANVILMGHMGRPEPGKLDPRTHSSKVVADWFKKRLRGKVVHHANSITEDGLNITGEALARNETKRGRGTLHVLENVRAARAETAPQNDPTRRSFARRLAGLTGEDGLFVMDAFGDIGSKGVSVEDMPQAFEQRGGSYVGSGMLEEFAALDGILDGFDAMILGGAKVEDKVPLLRKLMGSLRPNGFVIAGSGPSAELDGPQSALLNELRAGDPNRVLTAQGSYRNPANTLDISNLKAAEYISRLDTLRPGQSVLVNGTMGLVENPEYEEGTKRVFEKLAELADRGVRVVIVGGDGSANAQKYGIRGQYFTGGGVPLKVLAGERLVGVDALRATVQSPRQRAEAEQARIARQTAGYEGLTFAEIEQLKQKADRLPVQQAVETSARLKALGLIGANKVISRLASKNKVKALKAYFNNLHKKTGRNEFQKGVDLLNDRQKLTQTLTDEDAQKLRKLVKDTGDILAYYFYKEVGKREGAIVFIHGGEGAGRDAIPESFVVNQLILPEELEGERAQIAEAIKSAEAEFKRTNRTPQRSQYYRSQSGKLYPIVLQANDVVENTNAFINGTDGANSFVAVGDGLRKLKSMDLYLAQFITNLGDFAPEFENAWIDYEDPVTGEKLQFRPYDPELIARDPNKITDVLKLIADITDGELKEVDFSVMERDRETEFIKALERARRELEGRLTINILPPIKDGTFLFGMKAATGEEMFSQVYKGGKESLPPGSPMRKITIAATISGAIEAMTNISWAGGMKARGGIAGGRVYSKNVNTAFLTSGQTMKAKDHASRYRFTDQGDKDNEIEAIRTNLPDLYDYMQSHKTEHEAGAKDAYTEYETPLITHNDVDGDLSVTVTAVTDSKLFGLRGTHKTARRGIVSNVVRFKSEDGVPSVEVFEEGFKIKAMQAGATTPDTEGLAEVLSEIEAQENKGDYITLGDNTNGERLARRTERMRLNRFFGANWKTHISQRVSSSGPAREAARNKAKLFRQRFESLPPAAAQKARIVIFPETDHVRAVAQELDMGRTVGPKLGVGVQSVHFDPDGDLQSQIDEAYRLGARFANVGHSLHRYPPKEGPGSNAKPLTNEGANKIMKAILSDGRLMPWYTIPVTSTVTAETEIRDAIEIGLAGIPKEIVATFPITAEPTYKISTQTGGESTETFEVSGKDAEDMSIAVRKAIGRVYGGGDFSRRGVNVGYGASITEKNSREVFAQRSVRNGLMGGSSYEGPTEENKEDDQQAADRFFFLVNWAMNSVAVERSKAAVARGEPAAARRAATGLSQAQQERRDRQTAQAQEFFNYSALGTGKRLIEKSGVAPPLLIGAATTLMSELDEMELNDTLTDFPEVTKADLTDGKDDLTLTRMSSGAADTFSRIMLTKAHETIYTNRTETIDPDSILSLSEAQALVQSFYSSTDGVKLMEDVRRASQSATGDLIREVTAELFQEISLLKMNDRLYGLADVDFAYIGLSVGAITNSRGRRIFEDFTQLNPFSFNQLKNAIATRIDDGRRRPPASLVADPIKAVAESAEFRTSREARAAARSLSEAMETATRAVRDEEAENRRREEQRRRRASTSLSELTRESQALLAKAGATAEQPEETEPEDEVKPSENPEIASRVRANVDAFFASSAGQNIINLGDGGSDMADVTVETLLELADLMEDDPENNIYGSTSISVGSLITSKDDLQKANILKLFTKPEFSSVIVQRTLGRLSRPQEYVDAAIAASALVETPGEDKATASASVKKRKSRPVQTSMKKRGLRRSARERLRRRGRRGDAGQAVHHLSSMELQLLNLSEPSKQVRDDDRIIEQVRKLEQWFGATEPEYTQLAEQIIADLDSGKIKLKGEEVHVLDGVGSEALVIGRIDRKIAETYGYIHETANVVLVAPNGKVLVQLRNKSNFDDHLAMYGGHLKVGQSHTEAVEDETKEESEVEELDSPPIFVGYEGYDESGQGDYNRERRSWFVKVLSPREYEVMERRKAEAAELKANRSRAEYKAHLFEIQKQGEGGGEVVGTYEFTFDEIAAAATANNPDSPYTDKSNRFITVSDTFNGQEETVDAFFTPDALDRLVSSPGLWQQIQETAQTELAKGGDAGRAASAPGGIDLNPALLNLQIKRDGNGVPLPVNQQPIKDIQIDGFLPVIINVTPINISTLPLLGKADTSPDTTIDSDDLSFLSDEESLMLIRGSRL